MSDLPFDLPDDERPFPIFGCLSVGALIVVAVFFLILEIWRALS